MIWSDIAQRSQEAAGADDLLDADVWCLAGHPPLPCHSLSPPPYSESVDAVLDLIEAKLPGRGFTAVGLDIAAGVGGAQASIEHSPDPCSGAVQAIGCTPALALLAAFALAMEAQDGG